MGTARLARAPRMARHDIDYDTEYVSPAHRHSQPFKEFDNKRYLQVMRVVGIFSLCVTVAVACASMVDSARSAKSERLLFQEGSGNLKEITKSRGGGLQALAQFTHRIVNFGISNSTVTPVHAKKASVRAAAMKKVQHAALGLKLAVPASKADRVHVSSKRLAKLSLSKLEDGEEAAPAADLLRGMLQRLTMRRRTQRRRPRPRTGG